MNQVSRREQILDRAAELFANSGFRIGVAEIASACGILPGSLYHHFTSKDLILVELVERYRARLSQIAAASRNDHASTRKDHVEAIISLAEAIAAVAVEHRAALIQTFLDASSEPGDPQRQAALPVERAMLGLLQSAHQAGWVKPSVDLDQLALQLCQSMLNIGFGSFHRSPGAHRVPRAKCLMLLDGLVPVMPPLAELLANDARRAADGVVARWVDGSTAGRSPQLLEAARSEFSRRGYEVTTIRQIAAAARMSTAAVYRVVDAKSDLLRLVMQPFIDEVLTSWDPVLASDASPPEKLDALLWVNMHLLARFPNEFRIQLAWLRESSPPEWSRFHEFAVRQRQIAALLAEGERSGAFRSVGATQRIRAMCLLELTFVPDRVMRASDLASALDQARRTLLAGALYA